MEEWKDIYFVENGIEYDYKNLYQVSNHGNVKSLGNGNSNNSKKRILKARKGKYGYERVVLYKNNKQKSFYIHRLVAFMFLVNDNPTEKIEINHIDENKTNNKLENLEWCTREYNVNFGTRNERHSKSNKGDKNPRARKVVSVDPFTEQPVFIWQYVRQATDFYGISKETLNYYLKGKRKSGHLYNGFLWYYLSDYESSR